MASGIDDRHCAALRHAEERKAVDTRLVDDAFEIGDEALDRDVLGLAVRQAAAARVVTQEPVALAQGFDPRSPDGSLPIEIEVAQPVRGAHQRRALPGHSVGDSRVVRRARKLDLRLARGSGAHGGSVRGRSPSPNDVARPAKPPAGRKGVQAQPAARHNASMTAESLPTPAGVAPMYGWRRVVLALSVSGVVGLLVSPTYVASTAAWQVIGRYLFLGLSALTAFGIFERWPRRLPAWIARWALQVVAVAVVIPPTV